MRSIIYVLPFMAIEMLNFNAVTASDCKSPPKSIMSLGTSCCNITLLPIQLAIDMCTYIDRSDTLTCSLTNCIFEKVNMLKDEEIDFDKFGYFCEEQSKLQPESKAILTELKDKCNQNLSDSPGKECESLKLFDCLYETILSICPEDLWNDSTECKDSKYFIEMCLE